MLSSKMNTDFMLPVVILLGFNAMLRTEILGRQAAGLTLLDDLHPIPHPQITGNLLSVQNIPPCFVGYIRGFRLFRQNGENSNKSNLFH